MTTTIAAPEVFCHIAKTIAAEASSELLRTKQPNHNYLGDDLDPALAARIHQALHNPAAAAKLDPYELAQLNELAFWRWVAFEGYAGQDPRAFSWFQRIFMTENYRRTGWPLDEFASGSVVEIGCGPLGMIETLPGRRKVAFDPLNDEYAKLFRHVRQGGVSYTTDLDGLVAAHRGTFDLGICFNVLDHTTQPRRLFEMYMELIQPQGHFLFQVNTINPGEPQSDAHRRMHPSAFEVETILRWLREYSFDVEYTRAEQPSPENEYFFMAWGAKR